jgi:tetratricopeptide (TPR) repeat protein
VLYKLGHVDEALRELRQAVAEEPQSAQAEFQLGLALFASGAQQAAKAAFEQAVKLDPRLVEARINLGQLQENENQDGRGDRTIP